MNTELRELLQEILLFLGHSEVGNAYLSRDYVNHETELRDRITEQLNKGDAS